VTTHRRTGGTLRAAAEVRKEWPEVASELRSAAIELTTLRHQAYERGYGEWTAQGFFTRQSLEQSTAPAIAAHHAARFAGRRRVVEICTGAGCDTAALAKAIRPNGGHVTSIEADRTLAECARRNLATQGVENVEVVCGQAEDVISTLRLAEYDGLWCDPSRRTASGRRVENTEEYHPPLSFLQNLTSKLSDDAVCGVKISPAVTLAPATNGWKREWTGFAGECREQVLWRFGRKQQSQSTLRDGTVSLVDCGAVWQPPVETQGVEGHNVEGYNGKIQSAGILATGTVPQGWLVEPHPALIRSGHLSLFFAERGVALLDERIAYGIAPNAPSSSPFYEAFQILEAFPYNRKRLVERVRTRGWGTRTEIKKRGFPESPETVRSWLHLNRSNELKDFGVVILTRRGVGTSEQHWVILAERI
jgi:hypothetical protein